MLKTVNKQIERILDEGKGASRSVIVQMAPSHTEYDELIGASTRAVRRRALASSVRDLLPPPAKTMTRRKTVKSRTELRSHTQSLASQVAAATNYGAKERLKLEGASSIQSLLHSDTVKASVVKQRRKKTRRHLPKAFWSCSSVALTLDKDALHGLPRDVMNIAGVYPNRRIELLPIVKVDESSLPTNITENKTSAWGVNAIGAMSVWGAYGAEGQGVKVAVLDTGVDASHPDLQGRIGVSDFAEFDFDGNRVSGAQPHDSGQHGTHVSGTIAGGGVSGQWIGVAPQAKIAGGLVLKRGSGTDAQILAGIEWAIEKGVDVINMSLGGLRLSPDVFDTYTQAFITANQAGIPVVVAIGNEGSQTSGAPGNDFFSFAVGATDSYDNAAGFSGGRTQIHLESNIIDERNLPLVYSKPDVSAPGVAIKSCIPGNKYESWNGTSMATPHVAGAIALLLSATNIKQVDPSERAFLIQDLIVGSTEELGEAGQDHRFGFGRVDILKAVGYAWELGYGQ